MITGLLKRLATKRSCHAVARTWPEPSPGKGVAHGTVWRCRPLDAASAELWLRLARRPDLAGELHVAQTPPCRLLHGDRCMQPATLAGQTRAAIVDGGDLGRVTLRDDTAAHLE